MIIVSTYDSYCYLWLLLLLVTAIYFLRLMLLLAATATFAKTIELNKKSSILEHLLVVNMVNNTISQEQKWVLKLSNKSDEDTKSKSKDTMCVHIIKRTSALYPKNS